MSMKHISFPLTISLLSVVFVCGVLIGFMISPSYQEMMAEKNSMSLGAADRFVDLRYINKMIAHHRGAIRLAQQAEKISKRNEILELSREIQKNEPRLIEELYQWKKKWFFDSRRVADPVVAQLGTRDSTSDLRFLNALIAHHQKGIEMTHEIRTKSSRSEILDNADAVEQFLTQSATMLKSWREEWYSIN